MIRSLRFSSIAILSTAIAVSGHAADQTRVPAGWADLHRILSACATTTKPPLPPGESDMVPAAPILGNGEVGAVVTGDKDELSLFVSHSEFRDFALGGVDILPDAPCEAELIQDIERSEVRATAAIRGGGTLEATVFVAEAQPLVFCKLSNPGAKPLALRIRTWARPPHGHGQPPLGMTHPFCIIGKTYADRMNDRDGIPVFDRAQAADTDVWQWVVEDGGFGHVRNVATGRYLALTQTGKVEMHSEADPDTRFEAKSLGWPYFTHFIRDGREIGIAGDDPVAAEPKSGYTGLRVEGAPHRFTPGFSDREGDIVRSGREETSSNGLVERASLATRVLGGEPATGASKDGEIAITLPPRAEATVAIAVTGVCDRKNTPPPSLGDCEKWGVELLRPLTPEIVSKLSEQRVAAWREFWQKSRVDTGDPLINRAWYGGLHLLRCAAREGHTGPGLYGLWHTVDHVRCGNGEFNNYNYPSQIYGACTANHPELADAQFDDILREIPNAQRRAAAAGYQGACWQRAVDGHPASDKVLTTYPQPPVAPKKDRKKLGNDQLDAGAFLAQNFIDAYEKTLDPAFQKKAYPMLRVCADFYEDYISFNPEKNRYELRESGAREGKGEDLNPCFSLAMIKRVLARCADWSEDLGVDADRRAKWRDIAARMSAYPTAEVNGKTVFKEAENDSRLSLDGPGGNTALLQMVFPADDIGLDSDPKLLETARNTLAWFNSNPKDTSWMQADNNPAYIHAQAATLGLDASEIHTWLRRYLEAHQNPNLLHNLWGVESAALTEGIQRMLLQGHGGVLRLFPAWPKNKDASFVRLRAAGAFLVSARLKDGVLSEVSILSEKGRGCAIVNPWPGAKVCITRDGKPAETVEGERFALNTHPGEQLELSRK